jgi:hypothetical protein
MKKHFVLLLAGLSLVLIRSCESDEFQYKVQPSGIIYSTGELEKRITFFGEKSVRISVVKKGRGFRDSSLVVISQAMEAVLISRTGKTCLL